jgi:CBS domain-containing protein
VHFPDDRFLPFAAILLYSTYPRFGRPTACLNIIEDWVIPYAENLTGITKGEAVMDFTVKEWMIDLVVFIDPDKTVSEALALMRRRYISSLIVNKSALNADYGIVTSTDISDKIIAQGRNPSDTKVGEIMTSPFIPVKTNMTLKECSQIMKAKNIHHLPVAGEDGNIVGMISATDFLVAAEAMGRDPGDRII